MNRIHKIKHSDIQISDTQGHAVNIMPNNRTNNEQIVSDQGDHSHVSVSDKQDDNIKTQKMIWQDQQETEQTYILIC